MIDLKTITIKAYKYLEAYGITGMMANAYIDTNLDHMCHIRFVDLTRDDANLFDIILTSERDLRYLMYVMVGKIKELRAKYESRG